MAEQVYEKRIYAAKKLGASWRQRGVGVKSERWMIVAKERPALLPKNLIELCVCVCEQAVMCQEQRCRR